VTGGLNDAWLLWNEGLHNGRLLNDAQSLKMLTSHATLESGEGSGYGIVLWKPGGHRAAGNAGGFRGYDAALYRYLDDRITTSMLANQTADTLGLNDVLGRVVFSAQSQ
jgi:hypothetical protein